MQAEWFSFELGGWMDSSSNEKVMELSAPTKRRKLRVLHAWNCWHFESEDQEG